MTPLVHSYHHFSVHEVCLFLNNFLKSSHACLFFPRILLIVTCYICGCVCSWSLLDYHILNQNQLHNTQNHFYERRLSLDLWSENILFKKRWCTYSFSKQCEHNRVLRDKATEAVREWELRIGHFLGCIISNYLVFMIGNFDAWSYDKEEKDGYPSDFPHSFLLLSFKQDEWCQ